MTLGEKIAERKTTLGITSDELSARADVPLGTLNKILNGETKNPTGRTLAKIASVLNCTVEFLYGGDEGTESPRTNTDSGETVEKQELIDIFDRLPDSEKLVALRMLRGLINSSEK